MTSMLMVRHRCDKCGAVVELDFSAQPLNFAPPAGWELIGRATPVLLCKSCLGILDTFREANERVEQSR